MIATSYDVRIWSTKKYQGTRRTSYRLRWRVAARTFSETFASAKLADSFRAELMIAVRDGVSFSVDTGLPEDGRVTQAPQVTWFEFAVAYARMKWPDASPRHRKGIAEALTALSVELVREAIAPRERSDLRLVLNRWAFNAASHGDSNPPRD